MNKKKMRKIFMVLMILTIVSFSLFLTCFVCYKKYTGKEYVKYMETSVLDYLVCYVQPNELDQGCLPQSINNYVTKYIDIIKLNFNYKFDLSREVDTTYKYRVVGELTIYDRNNHSLVMERKEYALLNTKELSKESTNTFTINELLDLNYSEYNQYVENYRKNSSVSSAANLKVTLYIESSNGHDDINKEIKASTSISVDIPLGEQTIQLDTKYNPSNQSPDIEVRTNKTIFNEVLKILSFVFSVLTPLLVIAIIYLTMKNYENTPIYNRLINELKNDFDYEISELTSLIDSDDEDNYQYFDTISFKELYDLVKVSIDKKIFCNEKKYYDKQGKLINRISWFFVFISDEKVMRFIVDENKLNEEYNNNKNVIKRYRG